VSDKDKNFITVVNIWKATAFEQLFLENVYEMSTSV